MHDRPKGEGIPTIVIVYVSRDNYSKANLNQGTCYVDIKKYVKYSYF